MTTAVWWKLKDGNWGIKIGHNANSGEEVTLTNKAGKASTVWLKNRIAKFEDGNSIWSIAKTAPEQEEAF